MSKSHKYEVDQSIKFEELNKNSVIGIGSTDKRVAYVLPKKVKRHFNEQFRLIGQPKKCAPTMFAASIIAVLHKSAINPGFLQVDTDYEGYDKLIHNFLSAFLPNSVIAIARVGKNSPGHEAAYFTHKRKRDPEGILTQHDLNTILNIKRRLENHSTSS